jgi:predicted DNA binding CopG/RHH family protein
LLNRRKYKNLLKDFDRDEFGGKNFMKRLNRVENEENAYSSLTDKVDEMSLDQHLECLSNRYLSNNNIPQNKISTAEDLEMRVIPMSLFSPNIQMVLEGKRVYYQTVKKGTMKIKISLPAIINNYEFSKFTSFLKKELESAVTCFDFFQKFNKEFLEKGLNIKIKVNKEPILPAKTTLEYLLKLYESSEAKIKFVQ